MKDRIPEAGTGHLSGINLINRELTEKALKMRCVSYLANVKLKLLTATIFEVNASKTSLKQKNKNISKQSVIINKQKEKLEESNLKLKKNEKVLENKVKQRTDKLFTLNKNLKSEIKIKNNFEDDLQKTLRTLKVVSKFNQLLVKVDNEQDLLNEACKIVVEIGGYRLCWVGFAQNDNLKTVLPVAQYGYEDGYLESTTIRWDDSEYGDGPTGKAIKSGNEFIAKDIMNDPNYAPWRKQANQKGYASSIALPLHKKNDTLGALNIYSIESEAFDDDELTLLKELASNLAFGIQMLSTRIKKKKAEQSLKKAITELNKFKNLIQEENVYLQEEIKVNCNFENIICSSKAFKDVHQKVKQVAQTNATVLILGETGTGKELIARAVHNMSNRNNRALVMINCAALSTTLIESELFGHEKGAFTGAINRKLGRFELANNGTIFLDEIGDFPMDLQTKLLRVLQEKEFERLGGNTTIKVNIRVIAATNRNLEKQINNGKFRADLFYRLNIFPIQVPPLREHLEDIPLLINHFVEKYSAKTGKTITSVAKSMIDSFNQYNWPGNVRELENLIERAIILSNGSILNYEDINLISRNSSIQPNNQETTTPTIVLSHKENEYILINNALAKSSWVIEGKKGAASLLAINPSTLRFKIKKHGIKRPNNKN